ncbi:MAG TPA: ATP-binding cassette domain-containing protein [Candidatus Limnocylindrales bacterium]|nr:ATP-binding cassette domain-containing protein [Candidatus Limnocylindrales bacterium]
MSLDQKPVSVRGLRVNYGKITALQGIDLDLEWNQPVAVLGPNGAGKTTLINVLTTILGRFEGQALMAGMDVRQKSSQVRALLGLMPQDNNLYEPLSALDNLLLQGALHGVKIKKTRKMAADMLVRMGLGDVARRPVSTYSGGMKRRLVYARSILHRPRIVFLDEPTTGLDVQARYALWEDIEKFSGEGRTVVLTTHYIEEAEKFCRRIIIIDHGKVIADGSPEALKAKGEKTLEEVFLNLTGKELRKG